MLKKKIISGALIHKISKSQKENTNAAGGGAGGTLIRALCPEAESGSPIYSSQYRQVNYILKMNLKKYYSLLSDHILHCESPIYC